jgi:UDP-N-acetyl-2-amino-2-deoxyglucuronate dehydrogenase
MEDESWTVWRCDDNGNRFVVTEAQTRDEAERLVAEFTARGHKQIYWAEQGAKGGRMVLGEARPAE